jgi:hypothetical protein
VQEHQDREFTTKQAAVDQFQAKLDEIHAEAEAKEAEFRDALQALGRRF